MPVHDWTRVDAGTFHDFHSGWIVHLKETLNAGVLPPAYYAMAEQRVSEARPDVVTLHEGGAHVPPGADDGGVAVAEVEPQVRMRFRNDPNRAYRVRGRRVTVRHVSDNSVVALIEIVSPANKDRRISVRDFVAKVARLIDAGINVLVIDLFPPRKHDPGGLHAAVWRRFDDVKYRPPAEAPLTLASYQTNGIDTEAFVEPVAVGQTLVDMPLFLSPHRYVNVPLEATYLAAYRGVPRKWREVVEGRSEIPAGGLTPP
jgi:hypothetical protein